ncbi:MAG: Tic22 family protein [Cyanobacteria bacterium P01_E01_bin.42]
MKMKSLVRWCLALGVAGVTLTSTWFAGTFKALALTEAQIIERLQSVPVFAVADENGAPLVARIPNQQNASNDDGDSVAGVFINPGDAEAFINRLKQENPNLGNKLQIIPVSLGDIYQLDRRNAQAEGVNFTYVPTTRQVELAEQVNSAQDFQGVPLFVAKGGNDGGYLTLQQNNEQVIPFFFEKERLEQMVARFKEQQPSLANTVEIQAIPLEGVIQTFEQNDSAELEKIVLIPTQASLEYINLLRQQQ